MSADFSIFLSDAVVLDQLVFQLWLTGNTVHQAVVYRLSRYQSLKDGSATAVKQPRSEIIARLQGSLSRASSQISTLSDLYKGKNAAMPVEAQYAPFSQRDSNSSSDLRNSDGPQQNSVQPPPESIMCNYILSQYRTFELMEHYLHNPKHFTTQFFFSLKPEMTQAILEQYYSFDELVMRELLGKKLNSRSRKDLDDVCDKTRISLGSCRRQFDNLKRVVKRVEDLSGDVATIIQREFLISSELAGRYACVNFISNYRIDTLKRKLNVFTFSDFEFCAAIFLKYWTSPEARSTDSIDEILAQDVRDVKAVFLSSKELLDEYRTVVTRQLSFTTDANSDHTQAHFRNLVRNVLSIGAGLSQSKEMKDIFVDLVEKVVEPFISMGWHGRDIEAFFHALIKQFGSLESLQDNYKSRYHPSFARLLTGIQLASIQLFQRLKAK